VAANASGPRRLVFYSGRRRPRDELCQGLRSPRLPRQQPPRASTAMGPDPSVTIFYPSLPLVIQIINSRRDRLVALKYGETVVRFACLVVSYVCFFGTNAEMSRKERGGYR
jgi:hypothetical protein